MDVSLKIFTGTKPNDVKFFDNFSVTIRFDSLASTFGFQFFFDPSNELHREMLGITKYNKCEIYYGDKLFLTGVMINYSLVSESGSKVVKIGGYSLPGVLADCSIPESVFPLQFDKLSLNQIADKLLQPFGIEKKVNENVLDDMEKTFKTTTTNPGVTVADFLIELATQKDIVLTHDETGAVVFARANPQQTALLFFDTEKDQIDGFNFELDIDGQGLFSETTIVRQASVKHKNAGQSSTESIYVVDTYRPSVKTQTSGDDNDTQKASEREAQKQLKSITMTVETNKVMIDGDIWRPNKTISVRSPELGLYKNTQWFIESVSYNFSSESDLVTLNCVLPGVYDVAQLKTGQNIFLI